MSTGNGNGDNRPPRNTPNLGLPVPGDAGAADEVQVIGDLADKLDALYAELLFQPGDIKASAAAAPTAGWLLCDGTAYSRAQYADLFAAIGTAFGAGDGTSTFNVPDLRGRFPQGEATPKNLGTKGGEASHILTQAEMPFHGHGSVTGTDSPDHAHYTSAWTGGHNTDHQHEGWTDYGFSSDRSLASHGAGQNIYSWSAAAGNDAGRYWPSVNAVGWSPVYGNHQHHFWTGGSNTDHAHALNAWSGGASVRHSHAITPEGGGAAHNNLPPFQSVNYFVKT
jgi:microcystin-dependent protein